MILCYEAINTIFSDAIPNAAKEQRPLMPVIDVLAPVKTVHCALGPILMMRVVTPAIFKF